MTTSTAKSADEIITAHRIVTAYGALAAFTQSEPDPLDEAIADLVTDLGLLAVADGLDYLAILKRAIMHWTAECAYPNGIGPRVNVDIAISVAPERASWPCRQHRTRKPRRTTSPRRPRS